MNTDRLIGEYVGRARYACIAGGGASKFYRDKDLIREALVTKYHTNGNLQEVLKQISFCEDAITSFLEESERCFGWPRYSRRKLREKLNISHQ
jgi:hypothetical protein